jgi:hypothetical protein
MIMPVKLLPTAGDDVVLFVIEDFATWGDVTKYEPHRVEIPCKFIAVQDGFVWVTIDGGSVGFSAPKVEINYLPKPEDQNGN